MGGVSDKARIDSDLIASLRENSRPLRPETLLSTGSARSAADGGDAEPLQFVLEELVARLERLEKRVDQLDASLRAAAAAMPAGHTLFVPTAAGYTIVERDEPPPPPGAEIMIDGRAYRATHPRRSPFPGDRRPCVVVEAAE